MFKKNFNKGKSFGGGFGGRDSGRSTMHRATCSECGRPCEVPFKPAPGKPVFCNNCFKKDDRRDQGKGGGFGFGKKNFGKSDFGEKRMYEAMCAECGEYCEVPFRPTGEKPVYCSHCFGGGKSTGPATDNKSSASKDQLSEMNAKLDRILKTLDILRDKKEFVVEKKEKATSVETPEKSEKKVKPAAAKKVKPAAPKKAADKKAVKAKKGKKK